MTENLPRVAYVTSTYPAASHTFILREVTALIDLGFEILPCAIREPDLGQIIGPEEAAAHAQTFYVLKAAKRLTTLPQACLAALKHPKRLLQTLGLAWRTAPPGLRGGIKQLFYLGESLILSQHLQKQSVKHIHNHFADHSANVTMLTSSLSEIPFSYTLHGPNELFEANKWYFSEKTARAKFVVCISHFARSQAMFFANPEHWCKLRIVHCGVVPERYIETKKISGPPQLLYVGRLTPIKGLRTLFQSLETIFVQTPDLTLKIIGDGDDRAHLEQLAAPFGDRVQFLGYRSQQEVAEVLATSNALVLPSYAEGLPVVLMEALASATPVICSQVAGVAELVEDGVCGFTVPAGDAQTLADRILTLVKDPELQERMGLVGREKVQAEFDIKTESGRIGALFAGQGGDDLRPDPLSA